MATIAADRIELKSNDSTSPFVISQYVGDESIADNIDFYAKITQDSNKSNFADVICYLDSGELIVKSVSNSSATNSDELPAFTGQVTIFSTVPTSAINQAFDSGQIGILALGQSNMSCRDNNSLELVIDSDPNVFQIAQRSPFNNKYILGAPLYFNDPFQNDTVSTGIGGAFARRLSAHTANNRRVVIIPIAEGGTGFIDNHWNKGDALYELAVQRANEFLMSNSRNTIEAVVWMQGEEDAKNDNSSYQTNLDNMINDLRSDLVTNQANQTHAKLPFIACGMLPQFVINEGASGTLVQDTLIGLPSRIANTGYADSSGLTGIGDEVHMTGPETRELGERAFDAYLAALDNDLSQGVPTAPSKPVMTPGDTTMDISWNRPAANPVVTGFTLQYTINAGAPTTLVLGDVTTYQLTGLTNDTDFVRAKVLATNSEGDSPYSQFSDSVAPSEDFPLINASNPVMFLLRGVNLTIDGSNRISRWGDSRDDVQFVNNLGTPSTLPVQDVNGVPTFDGAQFLTFQSTDVTNNAHSYAVFADVDANLGHNIISGDREFFFISTNEKFSLGTGPTAIQRITTTNNPDTGQKTFWMTRDANGDTTIGFNQGGLGNESAGNAAIDPCSEAFLGKHSLSATSWLSGSIHAVVWWDSAVSVQTLKDAALELSSYVARQ